MTMQKIVVNGSYQSIAISNDSAFWTPKLANVKFALGVNPDVSGDFVVLLAGLKSKLFIEEGSTLWVKVDAGESEILLDDEIIA